MTAILKVDTIQDTSGNNIINESSDTITIGASGDTIDIPSGVTLDTTGATVSGITQGITQADLWQCSSSQSISSNTTTLITGSWRRSAEATNGQIGSGMSESSGIFTFPSTGIYQVNLRTFWNGFGGSGNGDAAYVQQEIHATQNNSSYGLVAISTLPGTTTGSGVRYVSMHDSCLIDVTDTSNVKVKFLGYIQDTNGTMSGATGYNSIWSSFIRLGDT